MGLNSIQALRQAFAELKRNHTILEEDRKIDRTEIAILKDNLTDTRSDLDDARSRIVVLERRP